MLLFSVLAIFAHLVVYDVGRFQSCQIKHFNFCIVKFLNQKFLIRSSRFQRENIIEGSVTRLGNLLDFGQLLKAFGNN